MSRGILSFAAAAVLSPGVAWAQDAFVPPPVTIQWDAPAKVTVAGYLLKYGVTSGLYTLSNSVPGNVTLNTVSNLLPATTYYFAVASYDEFGVQSDLSGEIVYTTPAPPPPPPPTPPPAPTPDPVPPPAIVASEPAPLPPGWTMLPGRVTEIGQGPAGPVQSTNQQFSIQGIPPTLSMAFTNGAMKAVILGTVGAAVSLETSPTPANPASWLPVTNFTFMASAYGSVTPSSTPDVQPVIYQTFTPSSQTVDLPVQNLMTPSFYRLVMPYSYPVLADHVLRQKGFQTHLVVVRLPGLNGRDICHVVPEAGYVDYDEESYVVRLEKTGPTMREMAESVAANLGMNWTSASQFVYTNGTKAILATVVKTEAPESDPALTDAPVATSQITIDF